MTHMFLTILSLTSIIMTDSVSHKRKGSITMPRSEEVKQRMREEQRTKILEAASKVFARKGMAATMDDIAAEASISHGLAYRYFASKEAIFHTLVEQTFRANPMTFQ